VTHPDNLTDAQRAEISALLVAALATMPEYDPPANTQTILALIRTVARLAGYDGLFALAVAAVEIANTGLSFFQGNRIRHYRHAPDDGTDHDDPDLRVKHLVGRFATALIGGDPTAARFEFDGAQRHQGPRDQPTTLLLAMIGYLVGQARHRTHGDILRLQIAEGSRWPPVCDFCGAAGNTRWMFRCHGFDLSFTAGDDPAAGPVKLRMMDSEFWYCCGLCRPLVEARPPDWAGVLRRHLARRPDASVVGVQALFTGFQQHRLHRRAERLPATRPTPTPDQPGVRMVDDWRDLE
jgi:hypothetical protein